MYNHTTENPHWEVPCHAQIFCYPVGLDGSNIENVLGDSPLSLQINVPKSLSLVLVRSTPCGTPGEASWVHRSDHFDIRGRNLSVGVSGSKPISEKVPVEVIEHYRLRVVLSGRHTRWRVLLQNIVFDVSWSPIVWCALKILHHRLFVPAPIKLFLKRR